MSQRWVRAGGEQYQQQAPRQNHAHQATRDRAAYLAQARQRSKQQRDYFDDDDDDDEDELLRETACLLYTSPSPRDGLLSRMPSSA